VVAAGSRAGSGCCKLHADKVIKKCELCPAESDLTQAAAAMVLGIDKLVKVFTLCQFSILDLLFNISSTP
jgi:hypothetical protein